LALKHLNDESEVISKAFCWAFSSTKHVEAIRITPQNIPKSHEFSQSLPGLNIIRQAPQELNRFKIHCDLSIVFYH
jgi:hypothetical protein